MNLAKLSIAAVLSAPFLLAGCKGGGAGTDSGSSGGSAASGLPLTSSATLLASFVSSLDSIRADATRLLTQDARYTRQTAPGTVYADNNGNGRFDAGVDVRLAGNPIEHAGIHYAHAAGLTGAGEVIAFSDSGFRASHDVFAGKNVTVGSGVLQTDHGTFVASVAAGNSPSMIGVAPGADVIFGSYATPGQMSATADAATAAGAVALNNSWGYTGLYASAVDYSAFVSSAARRTYLASLKTYAQNGIVVFAAPNDTSLSTSGLMASLPVFEPDLEQSWLAVVNGVPEMNGDDIVSAQRVSAACLEAAAWCISANGSWTGAEAGSDSSYDFGTGTSFAAPTVAGALALLAEAFPAMTHQQLRIRLLASADNEFAGFTQSGTTQLAADFEHAYSSEWGHGFLDVAAALLPIGRTTVTTGNGAILSAAEPLVTAGSASGDAVSRSLRNVEIVSKDSLAATFAVQASQLVARPKAPPLFSTDDLMDFGRILSASSSGTAFFGNSQGHLLPLANDAQQLFLFHSPDGDADRLAIGASRSFDLGTAKLHVGTAFGNDTAALLSEWSGGSRSSLAAVDLALSASLSERAQVKFELGYAYGNEASQIAADTDVLMNASAITYSQHNVLKRNDGLSVSLSLPAAIASGATSLSLPVASASGAPIYQDIPIDLAPDRREVRLMLNYEQPMTRRTRLGVSLVHAQNRGNIAGQRDTAGMVGLAIRF